MDIWITYQLIFFSLLCEREIYDWERLFDETETKGGSLNGDAFEAIKEATTFPFNPVAHKMIVVLMTKKQVYVMEMHVICSVEWLVCIWKVVKSSKCTKSQEIEKKDSNWNMPGIGPLYKHVFYYHKNVCITKMYNCLLNLNSPRQF